MNHRQFIAFVAAGGTAAAANFGSRILLSHYLPYAAAIVIAYVLGMITAFALNRFFVFKTPANAIGHQVFWFTAVNIAAVIQTLLLSLLFARIVFPRFGMSWYPETVAHAIGVAVPVVTSYIGHKKLSFK